MNLSSREVLPALEVRRADLSDETSISDRGIKDVVDVDRQHLKEALLSGSGDRIGGVVRVGPGVRTVRETAVCEVVDDALVGVFLRAHENQTIT